MAATLPDKPSDLIELALADLEKCEADPRYRIDMNVWHRPNGHCAVCFAGSVMAQSLGVDPRDCVMFTDEDDVEFGDELMAKFHALNEFRGGYVWEGLNELRIVKPARLDNFFIVTPYTKSRDGFRADMRDLAEHLRSHGL